MAFLKSVGDTFEKFKLQMMLIRAFEKSNKKSKGEELSFNLAFHLNNVGSISEVKKLKCY